MSGYIPTGNEYLSVPTIREADASIESLNIALMKLDGLLEISGPGDEPLISCPALQSTPDALEWSFREDWIPEFARRDAAEDRGVICAPPGERFLFVRALSDVSEFKISIGNVFQTANIRHWLPNRTLIARRFSWANETGIMVDIYAGTLIASLAFRCPGDARYLFEGENGKEELDWGKDIVTPGDVTLYVECATEPLLVVGVNLTSIGAMSAALEVGRVSVDDWLARSESWLTDRKVTIPGDAALEGKANRNGHFARFFGMAKTLDTDEVVSMTSRSHRYYVSSAYWDRDSLLWLYPFLVRNDKKMGEELLRYALGRQLKDAGIHSRYISGRILEFGFELDELLAPLIAMGTWNELYPEDTIWEEAQLKQAILSLFERLKKYRRDEFNLYWTELMPTDDRIDDGRDMLTYDNVLVIHAFRSCLPILEKIAPQEVSYAESEITAVSDAIRKHLVRDGKFMWSCDTEGNTEMYDEAAGSLLLLPYYGFCGTDDAAYRAAVDYFYSSENPYCLPGNFSELGNRHTGTPHPWVLSACNSVLSGARVEEGLDFLRRSPMDNGIACESVNIDSGEPETGYHFATCAGFVAHAIVMGTKA